MSAAFVDEQLERELGGEAPASLAALGSTEQARLATTLKAAKQRQQKHLGESIDEALRYIPALLRGPIRRLFD